MEPKMKVEIWSDIVCPFCYIGKRRFEAALDSFPHKNSIEVIWRSYQLYPSLEYQPGTDVYSYIAGIKGQSIEWSVKAHNDLTQTAKGLGLDYRFDKAKVANTFDAHRIIQLARKHGRAEEIEERFFKAYFTEGELMSDHATLIRLATEAGLDKDEVARVLAGNDYADDVRKDTEEAERLGGRGVPFFVINRKHTVYGAQETAAFFQALSRAHKEWEKKQ